MKYFLTAFLLLFSGFLWAQDLVLVRFTDKPEAEFYFENPTQMLTQKALDRRIKYEIDIDSTDVPVYGNYITDVEETGIEIIGVSRWFNGVFAWCSEEQADFINDLPFVEEIESFVRQEDAVVDRPAVDKKYFMDDENPPNEGEFDFVYGYTEEQTTQINLHYLHDLGFTGEGVSIAVMDNGFPGVNSAGGFSYIRENGQIKDTYNFVEDHDQVYTGGSHGTVVLSTIAGYRENDFVGTAINADFYLYITENNSHEMPDEEINWILAAERADSLGVDVINTSLGYYDFDNSKYDYVYQDMDGQTTFISRGAQIAAEKGIMVVAAAGNSGNNYWHYINAPADAKDVFSIGAVNSSGEPASFSSYGPTYDQRIKPDISARGVSASVISGSNQITTINGTSFSSPIIAGAMACLIQAYPDVKPARLRQKVRNSSSLFNDPDAQMGYGIPDFGLALETMSEPAKQLNPVVKIYPNPTEERIFIDSEKPINQLELISFEGKFIHNLPSENSLDMSRLPKGIYLLRIKFEDNQTLVERIVKK